MDEVVGMLSVTAVLVFGVWFVDYSGDAARASVSVRSAGIEAAHYAASALQSPPTNASEADLDRSATAIAERVVGAAAIGDCDTADQRFGVSASVHRLPGGTRPAAVTVDVTCPLAVTPIFVDVVDTRIAVPVPEMPGSGP